ncbi:hypothetical protein CISG_01053 [Coccidioides immitis RMSCC 3703]|uniref:Uncharacterized protein n=2 Tax=Coccidioides immitis TaxID=5501 RepID=A0A0J8QTV5_COCIT|nr:hypothetical protein CIRG_01841 [Coccidioides immitis RMSCC 2394]KMU76319.1 hypothetical protein CISG_01053 [Coccidioides immitis RMSCC 3703]
MLKIPPGRVMLWISEPDAVVNLCPTDRLDPPCCRWEGELSSPAGCTTKSTCIGCRVNVSPRLPELLEPSEERGMRTLECKRYHCRSESSPHPTPLTCPSRPPITAITSPLS